MTTKRNRRETIESSYQDKTNIAFEQWYIANKHLQGEVKVIPIQNLPQHFRPSRPKQLIILNPLSEAQCATRSESCCEQALLAK